MFFVAYLYSLHLMLQFGTFGGVQKICSDAKRRCRADAEWSVSLRRLSSAGAWCWLWQSRSSNVGWRDRTFAPRDIYPHPQKQPQQTSALFVVLPLLFCCLVSYARLNWPITSFWPHANIPDRTESAPWLRLESRIKRSVLSIAVMVNKVSVEVIRVIVRVWG